MKAKSISTCFPLTLTILALSACGESIALPALQRQTTRYLIYLMKLGHPIFVLMSIALFKMRRLFLEQTRDHHLDHHRGVSVLDRDGEHL